MAKVETVKNRDGTEDIFVRPDPAIFEIMSAVKNGRERRQFQHKGSLVNLIMELRARGVERITLSPKKKLQVERELRAIGKWDELKHFILGDN